MVSAAILPLHDPIRIAEQIAVLDNAAPGRLWVVVGAGYRVEEFEMAGVDHAARGKILEEYVEALIAGVDGRAVRVAGPHGRRHAEAGVAAAPDGAHRRGSAGRGAPRRAPAPADAADEHRPGRARRVLRGGASASATEGFVVETDRPDVRARGRRSRAGVGRDRAVRAVRGADVRVVPDARAALDARREGRVRRRPQGVAAVRGRHARAGARPTGTGSSRRQRHLQPARRRAAARPRLGEPRAVRGPGPAHLRSPARAQGSA